MSNHPYRQKMTSGGSELPEAVEEGPRDAFSEAVGLDHSNSAQNHRGRPYGATQPMTSGGQSMTTNVSNFVAQHAINPHSVLDLSESPLSLNSGAALDDPPRLGSTPPPVFSRTSPNLNPNPNPNQIQIQTSYHRGHLANSLTSMRESAHINNSRMSSPEPFIPSHTAGSGLVSSLPNSTARLELPFDVNHQMTEKLHKRNISLGSSIFDRLDSSFVDGHSLIQQYLGLNSHKSLPRIKTLELYRQNAKKLQDPTVLFQYAQYTLQTALMMEGNATVVGESAGGDSGPGSANNSSLAVNKKSSSSSSTNKDALLEAQLKRELILEALTYLRRLSDKGYVDAQYLLADAHSLGVLKKTDNKVAFLLFQSAAKHGHVELAYRTSYCYEEGLGTGRDSRKAVDYLKMAALKNHPAAMYKLGMYMFYGRMGMPQNSDTQKLGIKWLVRALNVATELTAAAPYELGKIYTEGFKDIVIPDRKYALELFAQAAALGHVEAARSLGIAYEVGDVVPQDLNLSIHYYTQAALAGDAILMLAMCAWYLVGLEPYLPKDEHEAFEWATRAAMADYAKAQFAVGNFYEKGVGCEMDIPQLQMWYKKAAESGDIKSLGRIKDKEWLAKFNKLHKKRLSEASKHSSSARDAQEKDCVIM